MTNWDCYGGPLPSHHPSIPLTSRCPPRCHQGLIPATAPPVPLMPLSATQPSAADAALSVCVYMPVCLCTCSNIQPLNNMLQKSVCPNLFFSGLLNLSTFRLYSALKVLLKKLFKTLILVSSKTRFIYFFCSSLAMDC